MPVTIFSPSLAALPAVAIVTAGVFGALGVRFRRHARDVIGRPPERQPFAISAPTTNTAFAFDVEVAAEIGADGESGGKAAAVQLLDTWCDCPRSAWRALGARALRLTRSEACARTASQVILEGVLARHAPLMDAWLVRDFADTAWFSAPEDGAPSSSAVEMAARRAVTNAALALLAGEWLPEQDFERLTVMVVQ